MARVLLIGPDRDRAADLRSWLRQEGHLVTWERRAEGWQERERVSAADPLNASVAPPDPSSVGDLRAKYEEFRVEQRRALARQAAEAGAPQVIHENIPKHASLLNAAGDSNLVQVV